MDKGNKIKLDKRYTIKLDKRKNIKWKPIKGIKKYIKMWRKKNKTRKQKLILILDAKTEIEVQIFENKHESTKRILPVIREEVEPLIWMYDQLMARSTLNYSMVKKQVKLKKKKKKKLRTK